MLSVLSAHTAYSWKPQKPCFQSFFIRLLASFVLSGGSDFNAPNFNRALENDLNNGGVYSTIMKLYPTEEETSESRRNEVPRVPSANQSVDSLQTRQFVHSFGELDLTEENMDFLFLIVYDQSYRRHYVPEFVSRSNDTMVVLCDFFNCGGTTGTDEWFCYGIPGKEISLKDFKNYASLIEESCRYYFLIEVKHAPKGSNICFKELKDDNELVPFCRNTIIAIVKPE